MTRPLIYQMLPRLWGNGRFSGVDAASLDYFRQMGFSHIWYTGIIRHSTGKDFVKSDPGSPYAISDYYDVNPYLAHHQSRRMAEFESLVKRTHKAGLKVIIDFVPNHTGRDYSDSHGGIPHFDWCDYDWTDTFKTDYSHPDTWGRMRDIVLFWAGKGVDGFRCDMVEMVPPEFCRWLISEVRKAYPELIFIAEVYQKERYRQYIREVGFDYLYDKSGLYDTVRAIVRANAASDGFASARGITWNWQMLGDLQPHMLNFLENHDEQRLASPWFAGRDDQFAALHATMLLNTAPYMVYFGQEVGIDASEGHEGRTSIFSWCDPEPLRSLYKFIHGEDKDALGAHRMQIMERYRSLLALASDPVAAEGETFDLCYCQAAEDGFDADRHFTFLRHDRASGRTVLILCNFSPASACVRVRIPQHAFDFLCLDKEKTGTEYIVHVPAFDATVVRI